MFCFPWADGNSFLLKYLYFKWNYSSFELFWKENKLETWKKIDFGKNIIYDHKLVYKNLEWLVEIVFHSFKIPTSKNKLKLSL